MNGGRRWIQEAVQHVIVGSSLTSVRAALITLLSLRRLSIARFVLCVLTWIVLIEMNCISFVNKTKLDNKGETMCIV